MKRTILSVLVLLTLSLPAFAVGTDKQLDVIQNSSGGSQLSIPSVGSTLATDSNTLTLSNKLISGSSNTLSNIPLSALASGTALGVSLGGTGLMTVSSNGILYGQGTSAFGVASAGTQYQLFQAGASGVPAFGALHLDQSAAITGILPVGNGGTGVANPTSGGVLVGAGSSPVSAVTCSSSGFVLTWNGSAWVCAAGSAFAPAQNGSVASPQAVTAAGGISLSGLAYGNDVFMQASTTGTTVVTATPSITACTAAGQDLYVTGESATKLVTLQDQSALAGSGLNLNGPWTSGLNVVLHLRCDSALLWNEVSRQN